MIRSGRLFREEVTRGRLRFALVCGILMTLSSSTSLYFNFQLLAGERIVPSWFSFAPFIVTLIYGLVYSAAVWRQLRQSK